MEVDKKAIEPIGSMMTNQAQGSVQTKAPAQPVAEPVQVTTTPVDPTIREIEPAEQSANQQSQQQMNQEQASPEQIKRAVEQLNKKMSHSSAVFGIHEETNRVTIKIIDKETREVIKELPPEKTLDMIAKVWEMAGILVDERR